MRQNFLELYINLNKKLVKTMTIKSSVSATLVNTYLKLLYGNSAVDETDQTTWKYYRNIAGLSHPTDEPMYVTSLDTLETIVFSFDNLKVHTATREAYLYGTRYYYSLVNKYPKQEQLIMGILYPCDLQKAIDAEDGTILTYPADLVESQEVTLIEELEGFIKRQLVRWHVKSFAVSDELYDPAQHAILYLNILPKLFNLRHKRCRTNEVHSFHIREYLASHSRLDKYLPYMTLSQSLFLYRNLNYLERNSGKVSQFKLLVEKLLTDRRLPLAEFSVRQLTAFDSNYYPGVTARRKAINPRYNVPEVDYFELTKLFDKERFLVEGNDTYLDTYSSEIDHQFKTSYSSVTQSKDLESSVVDYNDAVPDPLEDILMRQWAYMASHGLYKAVINFKDPRTTELRALYAKDAFIYMWYVSLKSIGINVDKVPKYFTLKHRRNPLPTKADLLAVVDSSFKDLPTIAEKILNAQPVIGNCLSVSGFYELCSKLYEESRNHWILVSNTNDYYKRAQVANMVLRLYSYEVTDFGLEDVDINTWLTSNNLPIYDFDYGQAQELVRNVFMAATGLKEDQANVLKNIQRAMLSILEQMSSYSIQLLADINDSKIKPLNWSAIRLGNLESKLEGYEHIDSKIRIQDVSGSMSDTVYMDLDGEIDYRTVKHSAEASMDYPIAISVTSKQSSSNTMNLRLNTLRLDVTYDGYDPVVSAASSFAGMEYYLALTDEQRLNIKSIY